MTMITGRVPTREDEKRDIFRYLARGCDLADIIEKDRSDPNVVLEHDHPAFFAKNNPFFDFPPPDIINEMIRSGLISVETAPWDIGARDHPSYDVRRFRLTELGTSEAEEHGGN